MDPVTPTTSTSTVTGQGNVQAAVSELGSDVFLRLLVTQLQSQDPTNPVQNEDFVAQLAQFTTLEQATHTTDLLEQLVNQDSERSQLNLVGLLGRDIVTEGDILTLDKENEPGLSYVLDEDTRKLKVQVLDKDHTVVRNLDVNQIQKAGPHEVAWDGLDDAGDRLPEGPYQYVIQALNAKDQEVKVMTFSREKVASLLPGTEEPVVVASGRTYSTEQIFSIR
ncbi:MAG: hypothetical protein OEZ57_12890 [Nitrospirota bacterium]|nr:hypothetical protein [Nitrospirota bacterium]MDH5775795.1 hypothetical protein [Nitrospirota bacterium]